MASITIENIPQDLYDLLRTQATVHNHSIHRETIHCLEKALRPNKIGVEERLAQIRELRSRIQCNQFDTREIDEAIGRGRR